MSQWAKDRANAVAKNEAVSRDRSAHLVKFWSDFSSTLDARADEFNRAVEGKSDARLSIHRGLERWGDNELIELTFPFSSDDGDRVYGVAEIIGKGDYITAEWKTHLTRDSSEHSHSMARFYLSDVGDVIAREEHRSLITYTSLPLITEGENNVNAERLAELILEYLLSYSEHFR